MDKAVVTADYPITKDGRGAVTTVDGTVLFCGTGCLLIKREVFDELEKPYFRTDIKWHIKNYGKFIKLTARQNDMAGYGLHDINFGLNLYEKGIPITVIDQPCGQRKLVSLGKAGSNKGAHNIEAWFKIKKDYMLKKVKKWPVQETGDLVSVATPTGEILVSKTHAKKLIKEGLGTKPPARGFVIDRTEL